MCFFDDVDIDASGCLWYDGKDAESGKDTFSSVVQNDRVIVGLLQDGMLTGMDVSVARIWAGLKTGIIC